MSGSHQFYTVTGRALPLPPKRTPSRQSSVLRLPTRRAEEVRSTTVRTNSPGRLETPRGGEFSAMSTTQQRASQLVVYHASRTTTPPRLTPSNSQRSSKAASHRQAATPTPPPDAQQPLQEPTEMEFDATNSSYPTSHRTSAVNDAAPTHPSSEHQAEVGGDATPPRSSRSAVAPARGSSSDSSPCLNRAKPHAEPEKTAAAAAVTTSRTTMSAEEEAEEEEEEEEETFPAETIEMSSARRSYNPAQDRHHAAPSRSRGVPAAPSVEPHAAGRAGNDGGSGRGSGSRHNTATSQDPSASETSSYRRGRHSIRSPPARYADPHHGSLHSNSYSAALPPPPAVVDRHLTHEYSQHKLEARRASRPPASATADTSHQPMSLSTHAVAVVAAPPPPRYSTRSPRPGEDLLEMNVPIADRVRDAATSPLAHRAASAGAGVGAVEGTELLASLPRLQGRHGDDGADRSYRTVVRFIEYQPEEERPGLEAMLADYAGHEDALCGALGEAYGDDFELMKAAFNRGPSVPLLADRSPARESATPSRQRRPASLSHPSVGSESAHRAQQHAPAAQQHPQQRGGSSEDPQDWQELDEDDYTTSASLPGEPVAAL
ncbi:hypothetical protein NESM_000649100 [Novymonas esmeraldas]|uniref:Uncharacterized protein n=1 Tax=Novymonas esmeraldas TaxID=1808958 RepID=A0AAW0EVA8_9TRYP